MTIYHRATFLLSAAKLQQLPTDTGCEVAFAGRSNAGKSSALNAITNTKNLAKTSKTPGRTQLINFFELDETHRLVDLPGYGYAKVSRETKAHWQKNLSAYLETREALKGLILLMDIRHPLKELDYVLIDWALYRQLPVHILLTKADKLKRGPAINTLQKVCKTLKNAADLVSVQLFSATAKTGITEVHTKLDEWLYQE